MSPSTKGMIGRGRHARVDPAFDRFLQAPFDEDRQERLLTVVSVLARLDLDPWHEAAVLAALSPAAAIERLTTLFAKVPLHASAPRDVGRIASRLVGLLPQPRQAQAAESTDPSSDDEAGSPGNRSWWKTAAIVVLLVIVMISAFTGSPLDALLGSTSSSPVTGVTPSPLGTTRE